MTGGSDDGRRSERGTAAARATSILPYIVAATFFMEYLDTTIIATALPQMARSFNVEPNAVSVGMSAYMLTLAVFIPISGWIADRFGSRTVFGSAIVIFTLASLSCGLASNLWFFTGSRVLQGIGGAMMVPVGRMIVVRNTPSSQLMGAISTITWPGIIAPAIGPAAGGFITTFASWHWIFFLNLPVGLLALIATRMVVPNQSDESRRPLDGLGFLVSAVALTAILYGTELASHQDSSIPASLGLMGLGAIVGAFAIWRANHIAHPLLDPGPFRETTFRLTIVWGILTRIGFEAVPYLLPLLFQVGFGVTPFQSGLFLMMSAAGNLSMKFFTTAIFRRFGFRSTALVTLLVATLMIGCCGFLMPATPVPLIGLTLFIYGTARSLQFQNLGTVVYADLPDRHKGPASTINSVMQQMSIGMGIAFGALALRLSALLHGPHPGDAPIALGDFRDAFLLAAFVVLVSTIGTLKLPLDAGQKIGAAVRKS